MLGRLIAPDRTPAFLLPHFYLRQSGLDLAPSKNSWRDVANYSFGSRM
jgi:hypothetical protein